MSVNTFPLKQTILLLHLSVLFRLCFCDWRHGYSSCIFFAVLPVILLSHHVAHPSRQTTKSGRTFACMYFLGSIIIYTASYVELYQIKNQHPFFCLHQPVELLPPQLPCRCCCCRIAPTLALVVVAVATPLVNCCVAPTLAIVNLGRRHLDLMF